MKKIKQHDYTYICTYSFCFVQDIKRYMYKRLFINEKAYLTREKKKLEAKKKTTTRKYINLYNNF